MYSNIWYACNTYMCCKHIKLVCLLLESVYVTCTDKLTIYNIIITAIKLFIVINYACTL